MKITTLCFTAFTLPFSASIIAAEIKDFAGTTCKKSDLVTVTKTAEASFSSGPMKGYVNVTVMLQNGEIVITPIPPNLARKIKAGDKACRVTFLDND